MECVGSSLRVSGACQDYAREFTGRRLRLVGRLSRVAERLVGSLDDAVGARQEFARTSPKVSERLLGTRRRSSEEDHKTHRRECQRLSDCMSKVISFVVMYDCNI
ncbi:hypothetical protein BHE74_00057051 [Ensete ventricosum]|nr:hypothetical protein BHE74_00057051 [Ensete ventricosum]